MKCPHCNKNGFSTWKVYATGAGKSFDCRECGLISRLPKGLGTIGLVILLLVIFAKEIVGKDIAIVFLGTVLITVIIAFFNIRLIAVESEQEG